MRVLVTGANRGLGLELVRQYAVAGDEVIATSRRRSPELEALAGRHPSVRLVELDVSDAAQVEAVARTVTALDVLINNAGVGNRGQRLGAYVREPMVETFLTNAVAPVLLAQSLIPVLANSERGRVVNVSTQMGSFQYNHEAHSPVYAASKAALNMLTRALAREARGVIVIAVHPGWVQTDMGGKGAPLTAEQSVSAMRRLIERLAPTDSGQFFDHDGEPHAF